MSEIKITREDTDTKGRYIAHIPGKPDADLTFTKSGASRIIIDHTGVPDALRGTGVGRALVERAVLDARSAGLKIMPLCPFAKATIARNPDWHDVL